MKLRITRLFSAHRPTTLWLGVAGWMAAMLASLIWIGVYSSSPGKAAQAPPVWPKSSRISRIAGRPTLVMFIHPRCPCATASLNELARLLVRDRGLGRVEILFVNPPGVATNWARTRLWQQAAAIPGVTLELDPEGVEANRFGVETSGQALLYAKTDELVFQGGITLARGHEGDNPARTALQNLLAHQGSAPVTTPTFGCALFITNCAKESVAWNQ